MTFSDPSCVSEVMKTQDHIIDTKKVKFKNIFATSLCLMSIV